MAPKRQFEFFLLKYREPSEVRSVNIGIVLLNRSGEGAGSGRVRFTDDWSRVQELDSDADIDLLQVLAAEIATEFQQPDRGNSLMKRLAESMSNTVALSDGQEIVTDDPDSEIETLAQRYLV